MVLALFKMTMTNDYHEIIMLKIQIKNNMLMEQLNENVNKKLLLIKRLNSEFIHNNVVHFVMEND